MSYPQHVQEVVDEAQRQGGDLGRFEDDQLLASYSGLGATSGSSFGLKIKAEIDRREKEKDGRSASYVRAFGWAFCSASTCCRETIISN